MKWIKQSGAEIETNDLPGTVEYCESLNWERVVAVKVDVERKEESIKPPPVTRQRKTQK